MTVRQMTPKEIDAVLTKMEQRWGIKPEPRIHWVDVLAAGITLLGIAGWVSLIILWGEAR